MTKTPPLITNDNWIIRRRVMFLTLIWLGINVQYILILGKPTALNEQALIALLSVIGAIIGSYIFGAVWDDMNKRSFVSEVYAAPPLPPEIPRDEGP